MRARRVFLIQLFLWVTLLLLPLAPATAAMTPAQQGQSVQALESALFTIQYDQEPVEARLNRLEQTVFGQVQTGTPESRIVKLQAALSANALGPLSPMATQASQNQSANQSAATSNQPANQPAGQMSQSAWPTQVPQAISSAVRGPGVAQGAANTQVQPMPGETDYPSVTQMELKLFNKSYLSEDITRRLERIEKQVFKTVQTGALVDRVDNLRIVVLGDTGNRQAQPVATGGHPGQIPNDIYGSGNQGTAGGAIHPYTPNTAGGGRFAYTQLPGNSYNGSPVVMNQGYPNQQTPAGYQPAPYTGQPQQAYGQVPSGQVTPDMLSAMNEMEKQILGHEYPAEPLTARLDRLETKVFHSTSPEMSPEDRMHRIMAVASAGGTPSSGRQKAVNTFQGLLPIILTILPMLLL